MSKKDKAVAAAVEKKRENARAERKAKRENARAEKARSRAARSAAKELRLKELERLRAAKAAAQAERYKRRKAFYKKLRGKLGNPEAGFDYCNYGVLPRVELSVKGDRTSIAARLAAAGIAFEDMRYERGETRFKIRKKEIHKVIAILSEMCYNYQISAHYGIGRFLRFLPARFGLIVGLAASVACLYISYGYVWRVRIDGNSALPAAAVERALKNANIGPGRRKADMTAELVHGALVELDGVADASCEIVGTTLCVRVLEALGHTAYKKSVAYVSDHDATVTRIVMRSGTASVKRGDVVKRGAVLAVGDVYSTSGELLYTAECDAEVYGNVAVTLCAELPETRIEYRRTGRVKTKTVFGLFGGTLGKAQSPFDSYESVAHTANYDVLVPLYVTTYTFYETAPVEVPVDIDAAAKAYAEEKIEEMKFAGDFDYTYDVTPTEFGLQAVHLFLSGEALISRGIDYVPRSEDQNRQSEQT